MRFLSKVLAVVALLTLGYWTAVTTKAWRDREQKKREFSAERNGKVSSLDSASETPSPAKPQLGSPIAMLEIPSVGISAVVLEGAGERELQLGPGHIPGTSLPGEGGNVGVAGHRDSSFRPLRLLRPNDLIKLTTSGREHCYRVESMQIVHPKDIHVLYATERETLTLVTCYPFAFVGHAPKRFIVRADYRDCAL
jgi:sortase A